jgi:flavin-dependent dehydrogenase
VNGRSPDSFDVVVCGGGLAGLTLALQLAERVPEARVAVLERSTRPLPEACHKVGESSVEVGTHYLAEVLGLRAYLDAEHLPKNGLRFYCGDSRGPFEERVEIGPGEFPPVPSYQMDRGKLENDLRGRVEARADLREGVKVEAIELAEGDAPHRVTYREADGAGAATTLEARWVVDASGRRHLLRRQLGFGVDSAIRSSAAWFRVPGKVSVSDLVGDADARWHGRDPQDQRWLSTNHLTGAGYWVWLIPLSTGHTSVGIVAAASHHAFEDLHSEAKARRWLREHEPVLAAHLDRLPSEDFRVLKDYSFGAERFCSADRWSCVGEAGFFVDPLYSPGTDFIAYTNSFTTELVRDDLAGRLDPARVDAANAFLLPLARDLERTLGGLGTVFEHADVFAAKLWWDYFDYWAFMGAYFFHRIYEVDAAGQAPFLDLRERFDVLNGRVQALIKRWADLRRHPTWKPRPFIPLPMGVSSLTELHLELTNPKTPAETAARMERDLAEAEVMAAEILFRALQGVGPEGAATLRDELAPGSWGLPMDAARIDAEEGPRGPRRSLLPRVGRDLERAIGRSPGNGTPLRKLLERAGVEVPASEAMATTAA